MSFRLLGVFAIFTFASILGAQTADATLTGYVNDPSGSAVPNAKVTLTNSSTAVAVTTPTNQSGFYSFQYVLPGTYEIAVEATGFQRQVHPNLLGPSGAERKNRLFPSGRTSTADGDCVRRRGHDPDRQRLDRNCHFVPRSE